MKPYLTIIFCAVPVIVLAGCATSTTQVKPSDSESGSFEATAPRLTARDLARGECGLFVWTADQDRRFILFSQSQKNQAIWAGPRGETELSLTSVSGQAFQGQYTQQSFVETSELKEEKVEDVSITPNLKLALRNIEDVIDSTRFKGGTLSQTTADGGQRITPVVALSTCR